MADVADQRSQVIIVMGLIMAVTFVMLALLLNTVIFTENLAARGSDLGGREAVEFQQTVVKSVGQLVDEENDEEYATNASVRAAVDDGIAEIDRLNRLERAEQSVVADLSNATMHNGSVIRQTDSSRNFTDTSHSVDWILARDITDTRQFEVAIAGGLNSTTDPDDAYRVELHESGGADVWRLAIYENASTSSVELAVMNGTAATWTKDVCSPSSTPTVDLTGGTVDGDPCSALQFAKGITSPYDIWYASGDLAYGTYNLTVNVSGAGRVQQTSLNGPGPASSPYFLRAVYSVTVDVHYQTETVRYRAGVRIARGEPA